MEAGKERSRMEVKWKERRKERRIRERGEYSEEVMWRLIRFVN